jgi:hypothetical protein
MVNVFPVGRRASARSSRDMARTLNAGVAEMLGRSEQMMRSYIEETPGGVYEAAAPSRVELTVDGRTFAPAVR